MTKIAAILLSLSILIQGFNMDLEDISKIPVLANHFVSHIQQGEGFVEFIDQHYGSKISIHKNKHKEHKDLPFKHRHLDTHFHIDFIICNQEYPFQFKEDIFASTNFIYKEQSIKLFEIHFFQPPKLA